MLLAQIPIFLGGELGLGSDGENASWHGVILGAAWAPAVNYLKPWVSSGTLHASYLGAELTLDFATLHQGPSRRRGKRAALFFLLPVQDDGPVILTLSFGAVWY